MAKEKLEISNEEKEKQDSNGIYEVGYLLNPAISEENVGAEVSNLKDSLFNGGVSFISEEYPTLIELAYEMTRSINNKIERFSRAYFGWIKFEIEVEKIKTIKELLDKNENLIRFLLIKTVRENTLSPRKSYIKQDTFKRRTVSRQEVKEEETEEIDEEAIDKEIEALVS